MWPLLALASLVIAKSHPNELVWTVPDLIAPSASTSASPTSDFVKVPMNSKVSNPKPVFLSQFLKLETEGMLDTTGHLLTLQNPIGHFSILPPLGATGGEEGCRRVTTMESAGGKCVAATNAGFFNMDTQACIGNIVSDGTVYALPAEGRINFGVLESGSYVIGYLNSSDIAFLNATDRVLQLVQGAGWLVRDGESYVDKAAAIEGIGEGFVNQKAPRTLVGLDGQGNMKLFEIDGNEDQKVGPDLHQTAALAIQQGFVHAVNLDGGGSSTFVLNGKLCSGCGTLYEPCESSPSSFPAYHLTVDNSDQCQRAVTTITCVH